MLHIARTLHRRGGRVRFISNAPYASIAEREGLSAKAADTPADYAAFSEYSSQLTDFGREIEALTRWCVPWMAKAYQDILSWCGDKGPAVVVAGPSFRVLASIAERQWRSQTLGVLPGPGYAPYVERALRVFQKFCIQPFAAALNELQLELPDVAGLTDQRPLRVLALWEQWFSDLPPETGFSPTFLGFAADEESDEPPTALSEFVASGDPPVTVFGGSFGFHGPALCSAAMEGIASLGQRGVVIYAGDRAELPPFDSGAFKVIDWTSSFPWLLRRSAAIVHHGGIGTVGQALRAGVPQLCLSNAFDRPLNGRLVQEHGIGSWLERKDWSARTIARELAELIGADSPARRRARQLSDALEPRSSSTDRLTQRVFSLAR